MSKVEELRGGVYNDVAHYLLDCGHYDNGEREAAAEIDSLIAAAKEEGHHDGFHEGYREGRAGGAEQERERIRETYLGEVGGNYVIPSRVLDPKETDYDNA